MIAGLLADASLATSSERGQAYCLIGYDEFNQGLRAAISSQAHSVDAVCFALGLAEQFALELAFESQNAGTIRLANVHKGAFSNLVTGFASTNGE